MLIPPPEYGSILYGALLRHTLIGPVYGGLLSVLDLVELVPVIDVGRSDTGRVRETTPAKRHQQVGVRVVPFHPPRPAGGVSGQIHFRVTAGKSCRYYSCGFDSSRSHKVNKAVSLDLGMCYFVN